MEGVSAEGHEVRLNQAAMMGNYANNTDTVVEDGGENQEQGVGDRARGDSLVTVRRLERDSAWPSTATTI